MFRAAADRVGQRRLDDGRLGGGNAREAEGGFARAWLDRRRIAGRHGRGCDGRLGQLAMGCGHSGHGGHCVCQQRADRPGVSARNRCAACRPAVPDRRCGILDAGPLEAAEPRSAPPGNSDRSAQQHQRKLPRSRHRSPPPFGYRKARRTAGTRQDRLSAYNRFMQGKKAAGNHFSKRCCLNATQVSRNDAKRCKLEVITEIEWLAA